MNINDVSNLAQPWSERIIAQVVASGQERRRQFGADWDEFEYAQGAVAAMLGLGLDKYIPRAWVYGLAFSRFPIIPLAEGQREYTDAERLRALDKRARSLRDANGWGQPDETLEQCSWEMGYLALMADGYGGAWVQELDYNQRVHNDRYFKDLDEATAFYEFLSNNEGDWDELADAFVYQPEVD